MTETIDRMTKRFARHLLGIRAATLLLGLVVLAVTIPNSMHVEAQELNPIEAELARRRAAEEAGSSELKPRRAIMYFTANYLYDQCRAPRSERCIGYVIGVSDALGSATVVGDSLANQRACIPDGVMGEQIVDISFNYMAARPEQRHERGALTMVTFAIAEAYPCN